MLLSTPRPSKTLREEAWAPLKLHGGRICLSWHSKGRCFSNIGTCTRQTLDGLATCPSSAGHEVTRFATFVAVLWLSIAKATEK
jgi:hypothetical protein